MIALALALHLFATGATGVPATTWAGKTPAAPGAPKFAQLASVTGLPADSSMRAEFLGALRGVFALDEVPGERQGGDHEWKSGLPLPNRFRLLEGATAEDAWQLELTVGAPPPLHRQESASRPARTVPTRRM